jgi:hypothetical protein
VVVGGGGEVKVEVKRWWSVSRQKLTDFRFVGRIQQTRGSHFWREEYREHLERMLKLVESISLTFLHVAITTSTLPIDDALPLYFYVAQIYPSTEQAPSNNSRR